MKYLFSQLDKLKDVLEKRPVFLFLDYDGTLVPIAQRPDKAVISGNALKALSGLAKNPDCRVAVISGRSLKNIKDMVNLKDISYAGNHGLEIEGAGIKFKTPVLPGYKLALRKLKTILKKKLSVIRGAIVEDKGLTLSVHYRLVEAKKIPALKTIFYKTAERYGVPAGIKITTGKKVLEIRPDLKQDKGRIVLWLLSKVKTRAGKKPSLPVYIGDDVTDEDAFRALRGRGLTVFVGKPGRSSAEYFVRGTGEVIDFLKEVLKIKNGAVCRN
ncbi:MAG: trehalose-phosphatase [Candidatus Omnitrophota bacterium]|jgi:trehalose-phosphatase